MPAGDRNGISPSSDSVTPEYSDILNNFRQISSPWNPRHLSGARGFVFFTGNTYMNPSDAIEAIEKPLSSLPYSLSRHILEHLRKLTSHEPVIGIMGKSGAGKSSLCNALFQEKSPRSAMFTPAPGKYGASV